MDDAAGHHLLDPGHLFSSKSGVLAAIRLAKWRSLGLYGVLQERCTAQIILSLAHNVAEFLEEGLKLLLLGGRQMCGDRRRATRAGGGWWRRLLTCPQFVWCASGAALGGDCGSRPTLRNHW